MISDIEHEFAVYWNDKEMKGIVSSINRGEWMMIKLFLQWLLSKYTVASK